MFFGLEQEVGSLITPMALHPIRSRSRNKRWNLWVGWCVFSCRPWFWSVYSIYYYIHTMHYSCILSNWETFFQRDIYISAVVVAMTVWRVPGFATDCPCGVWCCGWTTCLLYIAPLFLNLVWNDSYPSILATASLTTCAVAMKNALFQAIKISEFGKWVERHNGDHVTSDDVTGDWKVAQSSHLHATESVALATRWCPPGWVKA